MEHYRLYLRAELGKLQNRGDARDFLGRSRCQFDRLRLSPEEIELTRQFASQRLVNSYVAELSDEELLDLTDCCGRWRNNGIERLLKPSQAVELKDVPITQIFLRRAEGELEHVFQENGWRLVETARDPRIDVVEAYRARGDVPLEECLADHAETAGTYRLIDGMHRSIRMVREGRLRLRLCVVADPPPDPRSPT